MNLTMQQIRGQAVPRGGMAVWWLGQAGFIVKGAGGSVVALDPYLSDHCGKIAENGGLNFHRSFPAPIAAAELVTADAYLLTHSHEDHLDIETITPYRQAGGQGPYVAPPHALAKLAEWGVPPADTVMMWPGKTHTVGDLTVRATMAIPFAGDDETHVGYLLSTADGATFYFTGDTAYHEVLGIAVAEHHPDVMFTVINGMWRNLSPADAARLAWQVQPKLVVPYHWDLFPDGYMPPNTLELNLLLHDMRDRYRQIAVAEPFIYPEG